MVNNYGVYILHERYSSQHAREALFCYCFDDYMTSHSERFASLTTIISVAAREV